MSQEVKTIFSFNGKEYEFDVRDADVAERFESAIEVMREDEKNQPKTGRMSELIKYQVNFLKKFFDNCLGEGAGNEVCGSGNKLNVCYDAYGEFLNLVSSQRDYLNVQNSVNPFSKYSNRKQSKASVKK